MLRTVRKQICVMRIIYGTVRSAKSLGDGWFLNHYMGGREKRGEEGSRRPSTPKHRCLLSTCAVNGWVFLREPVPGQNFFSMALFC